MNWQETRQVLIDSGIDSTRLPETWKSRIDLTWADLTWADLSGANLSGADLSEADLSEADLSGADLSGAVLPDPGFERVPEAELARLILEKAAVGQLEMERWHTCETAHCAWGWAVVLNGEKGLALERDLGTQAAGALLFPFFSRYVLASNERAVEILREIANR